MSEKYYSKRQCIASFLRIGIRDVDTEEIRYQQKEDGTCLLFYKNKYMGIYDGRRGKMKKYAAMEYGQREKMLL